jgi:chemotaxis protein methyltransferase CheR
MKKRIPNSVLEKFSDFISQEIGLHYPKERRLDLLKGIREASKELGFNDTESCIHWLMNSTLRRSQIEVLATHLTIGETYFLRESNTLDALEHSILPQIIENRRKSHRSIRIWSAGCCSGEEPYSLAILLHRLIPDISSWDITIFGTDINPFFLHKAAVGIYREWSFRGTPLWLREKYFSLIDDQMFELKPKIKKMVRFFYLNLIKDTYPSMQNDIHDLDIVFCRNVLMYFKPETVKTIGMKLYDALSDEGWLVVGSSEASHILFPQYETVNFPGAILYQKRKDGFLPPETVYQHLIHDVPLKFIEKNISIKEESIEDIPRENETVFEDALSSFDKGNYEEVINILENNVENQDENGMQYLLMSKAYANQGKLNDALIWCEKAIHTEKMQPTFYHFHAVLLQELGRLDGALASMRKALYLDPDSIISHYIMGSLYRQLGKAKASKKNYDNVIMLLDRYNQDEVIPEGDGLTAGRLRELVLNTTYKGLQS